MLGPTTDDNAKQFLTQISGNKTFLNDDKNQQGMFTAQGGDFNNALRGGHTAADSQVVMDLYKQHLQPAAQQTTTIGGNVNVVKMGVAGVVNAVTGLPDAAAAAATGRALPCTWV